MSDKSAQFDELLALKSIYEEEDIFCFDNESNSGKVYIKINSPLDKPFLLKFENASIQVENLLPLVLEFEFPSDYPSVNKPFFKLRGNWLSQKDLTKLCKKLDEIWTENANSSIIFTWINFLSYDLFDFLDLNCEIIHLIDLKNDQNQDEQDSRGIKESCSLQLCENYDKDQVLLKFYNSYFDCNICFMSKSGKDCFRFNKCNHVFCIDCLKFYFQTQINDCNVRNLTCPEAKCNSQPLPSQVLQIVGAELFNRYDSILLKDTLNNMTDLVYCPRADCQCAVIPEDTLAQCPDCNNVFCALCRQSYHGIEPCKITNSQLKQICNEFLNGDEFIKQDLIKRYGESRIKKAIEECSSMELIESTSKRCPNCRSWVQKLDGCNKMTCTKCHCYFCWICLKSLSKVDPYSHFNNSNSDCFEKLFEGVIQNDVYTDDEDEDFFEDNDDDDDDDEQ